MIVFLSFAPSRCSLVAPTCSNGVPGVEADGTCCVAECGTCGDAGCRDRAEAVGLDADDCCAQRISDSGVHCDDSEAAPCIVNNGECFASKSPRSDLGLGLLRILRLCPLNIGAPFATDGYSLDGLKPLGNVPKNFTPTYAVVIDVTLFSESSSRGL